VYNERHYFFKHKKTVYTLQSLPAEVAMQDITESILELVRLTSTDLPPDVEASIHRAVEQEEPGSAARGALETILKNVEAAVVLATKKAFLRPNSVDSITGKNSGNNLGGKHFPSIHFEEVEGDTLTIELMLKGGGCENVGAQYSLPHDALNAGRDLAGVRKAVLDAVFQAQGQGCAPGILGVAIGGDRGSSYYASKETLYRKLDDANPDLQLNAMENTLVEEANQLGIGPMGFGGKTTLLGTKITHLNRLPASFFVSVSYMCWAYRRRKMTITNDLVKFE
jgi:fumarate hydratase class I